ncbi:hypothetical protein J11TS1_23050 [Oceanobacillus sp. J11TS1]|nr:hypothetical protein J11TS1_23050 [Oceanobacillus sp. J11TS1]
MITIFEGTTLNTYEIGENRGFPVAAAGNFTRCGEIIEIELKTLTKIGLNILLKDK